MQETGKVINIDKGNAFIEFKRTAACGKCHACGMLSGQGSVTVKAPNDVGAKVGDRVEVEFSTKNALGTSAIAYLVPLAFLVAGLLIGLFAPVSINFDREVFAALLAICMTAAGFVLLHFLEPLFRKVFSNVYRIVEIVE